MCKKEVMHLLLPCFSSTGKNETNVHHKEMLTTSVEACYCGLLILFVMTLVQ